MLALTSYEQSNGFSALNADELYFINGGSGVGTGVALIATGVVCMAGGMIAAATAPATAGMSAVGAAGAFCTGATLVAYGLGSVTGSYNGNYGETVVNAVMPIPASVAEAINK